MALMSGDSSGIWPGPGILLCIGSDDSSPKSPMTSVLSAHIKESSVVQPLGLRFLLHEGLQACSEAETTQTTLTPRLAETKPHATSPHSRAAGGRQQHQSSPSAASLQSCINRFTPSVPTAECRLCVRYSGSEAGKVFPVS